MKKVHSPQIVLTLILLAALAFSTSRTLQAEARARRAAPTSVAVVDWLEVTQQLTEWQEIQARINDRTQELQEELNVDEKKLQDLNDVLKILPEAEREPKLRESELLSAQLRAKVQLFEQWMQREELTEQLKIYEKIKEAVAVIAQNEGYDIVMWNDSASKSVNFDQLQDSAQRVATRHVMYASDAVDITDQVAAYLNGSGSSSATP